MSKIWRRFVIEWNNKHPIDYWWRQKYSIPFNSKQHRQASLIDMKFEWEEDQVYKELQNRKEKEEKLKQSYEEYGFLSPTQQGEEDDEQLFNDLDLDNLDDDINF